MPSGFSRSTAPAVAGLLTALTCLGALAGGPARAADPAWKFGVFPVASFLGYTSAFGSRSGPWGVVEPHYGLDIAAPLGSPIRNWWAGRVSQLLNDDRCGVGLVIRSGNYEHIYCHMHFSGRPAQLREGQFVATGQTIGHVGMTGRTSGPHLHWGMRYRGQWLNPAAILRAMARSRRIPPPVSAGGISPKSPSST
ncbi:M23 family metallopeptidase [Cyanobium sp. HWJ4-Hawea]|uniref:M23 family metallopeptidase n=1 Tax=Cyanobium sp. HWJ4-Hawea TaxID=2823713 RepID=UPI0020CBD0AB|nr:M23 family metallopeptidase [Cyanobium sp. HWJ4-Hawea]MCP9809639.1 M23 family metallopeptidase [Cyanobium sp. HWJ4-Hawea]